MEGQAPDVVYFPSLDSSVPKPSENHKLGVSLRLFSNNSFGGVVKWRVIPLIPAKPLENYMRNMKLHQKVSKVFFACCESNGSKSN